MRLLWLEARVLSLQTSAKLKLTDGKMYRHCLPGFLVESLLCSAMLVDGSATTSLFSSCNRCDFRVCDACLIRLRWVICSYPPSPCNMMSPCMFARPPQILRFCFVPSSHATYHASIHLQGRLPIRVALKGLTTEDFYRILTEPENNMIKQQQVGFFVC